MYIKKNIFLNPNRVVIINMNNIYINRTWKDEYGTHNWYISSGVLGFRSRICGSDDSLKVLLRVLGFKCYKNKIFLMLLKLMTNSKHLCKKKNDLLF